MKMIHKIYTINNNQNLNYLMFSNQYMKILRSNRYILVNNKVKIELIIIIIIIIVIILIIIIIIIQHLI
jgi:hypothetical protein